VLILVLLGIVSFITVLFYVDYLIISLAHLCFNAFLSLYVVLIDVQLHSCKSVYNKLTYFLTYLLTVVASEKYSLRNLCSLYGFASETMMRLFYWLGFTSFAKPASVSQNPTNGSRRFTEMDLKPVSVSSNGSRP